MSRLPQPVVMDMSWRRVFDSGGSQPVRVTLRYLPADPYAVRVLFCDPNSDGEDIEWSFARDLLAAGLDGPAGIGDVRVSPHGDFVAVTLSTSEDKALFEATRSVLVQFLYRTYAQIPQGQELAHLDVDAGVRRLLDADGVR